MSGPRIVLNPAVFHDKRDALCVTFNEAFRVVCEMNGFEPVSEPTEKQRKFFADTAYADDELQLRRTILARIATLDTSVSDPTDEQLEETMEMLEMVMEVGAPQNEWEQQAVQRLHDVVAKSLESTRANGTARQPKPPKDEASTQADVGGGITDEDEDEELEKSIKETTESAVAGLAAAQDGTETDEDKELEKSIKETTESAVAGLAALDGAEQAPDGRPQEQAVQPRGEQKQKQPRQEQNPAQPQQPQQEPQLLATRVDEKGRHFDLQGRVITGRQAERMERAAQEAAAQRREEQNPVAQQPQQQPQQNLVAQQPQQNQAEALPFTVNAKGQYFAQNHLITKRAAERMLRKRRQKA